MTNKDKKIKEIEDSELLVLKKVEEYMGEDGKIHIKGQWSKCNGELNLGSSEKPNKEILNFKYKVGGKNPLGDIFGGLFGNKD